MTPPGVLCDFFGTINRLKDVNSVREFQDFRSEIPGSGRSRLALLRILKNSVPMIMENKNDLKVLPVDVFLFVSFDFFYDDLSRYLRKMYRESTIKEKKKQVLSGR